jgi:hypothetical protein
MSIKQHLFGDGDPWFAFFIACGLLLGASFVGIFARLTVRVFITVEHPLWRVALGYTLVALLFTALMRGKGLTVLRSTGIGFAASLFYWGFQLDEAAPALAVFNPLPLVGMLGVFVLLCRLPLESRRALLGVIRA